jgi:NADH-quinone oxidoreductase subunit A
MPSAPTALLQRNAAFWRNGSHDGGATLADSLAILDPRSALVLHILVVGFVVAAILLVAGLLREPGRPGFGVYESGAAPGTPATGRAAAPYFLIAVFFMIFDVEAAILFAWAIAVEEAGRTGLIAAAIFIAALLAALAYLWLDGALETGPRGDRGDAS